MNPLELTPLAAMILSLLAIVAINRLARHKLPPRPLVMAHICKHNGEDDALYCHVKITNPTASALMTITHVQHPGDSKHEVALCADLPRTLHGSQIIEFGFFIERKPAAGLEMVRLLCGWAVTDSLGRATKSVVNKTVPIFGAIAR